MANPKKRKLDIDTVVSVLELNGADVTAAKDTFKVARGTIYSLLEANGYEIVRVVRKKQRSAKR